MSVQNVKQVQQNYSVNYKNQSNTSGVSVSVSNGIYTVHGSASDDKIEVRQQPKNKSMVDIVVNGQVIQSIPRWQIRGLTIKGGAGNDQIKVGCGLGMKITVCGGAGDDKISTGSAAQIYGGAGNDTIQGSFGEEYINGGSGDDVIYAGAGNDTVDGGSGDDHIYGQNGHDTIQGQGGSDHVSGGAGHDHVTPGSFKPHYYPLAYANGCKA